MAEETYYAMFQELHAETALEDATRLGKFLGEKTTYLAKKYFKKALKKTVAGVGFLLAPATANLSSAASSIILGSTATASAGKTGDHIDGLLCIQGDLAAGRVACTCGSCLEAVGFAISAKQKKSKVKKATAGLQFASAVVPGGSAVVEGITSGSSMAIDGGSTAVNFGQRKTRAALAAELHRGARGPQTEGIDGIRFDHGCVSARAIIEELTGHWARVTFAANGHAIIEDKMQST